MESIKLIKALILKKKSKIPNSTNLNKIHWLILKDKYLKVFKKMMSVENFAKKKKYLINNLLSNFNE